MGSAGNSAEQILDPETYKNWAQLSQIWNTDVLMGTAINRFSVQSQEHSQRQAVFSVKFSMCSYWLRLLGWATMLSEIW